MMKAHGEVPNAQHCRRVVFVGRVNLRPDDSAGVEIDGVFRLVGQMVPSFILAFLASMRTRSSEDGVSIPLSPAIRSSIYRLRPQSSGARHSSIVEASTPIRSPSTRPCSAISASTPPRGPLAAAGFASSTARSGPAPVLSSADAETPERQRVRAASLDRITVHFPPHSRQHPNRGYRDTRGCYKAIRRSVGLREWYRACPRRLCPADG
jgi:hypothetical protein